jgi:hypothetical protein
MTAASEPDTGPIKRLFEQSYKRGYQTAIASMAHKPDEVVLKGLEGEAIGLALGEFRPEYNPAVHPGDGQREARQSLREETLKTRTEELDIAIAESRRRKDELAKAGVVTERPEASDMLRWTATIALTLSLAPTIHDVFAGLNDPLIAWLIALAFGSVVSLLMVTAILPNGTSKKGGSKE